ncbi:MAG TPA: Ig-like domain-containing protein, partial [Verrucomicrobiae bacterium]|nr:Ig-like domain-containing protein [Verrucomicrobiae bacterium]
MPEEQNLAPQETKNNESPSTVPAKPPIIDGRFKKLLTVPGLAIAAGVLIIVSLIVVAINNSQNPIALRQATVSNLLELVSVSPSGTQADPNQKLTLVFNYPVSAEHIQDFIKFTPNVPGLWNQGENDKTIVFTPEQPYFPGSKFRVTLLAGMPSESGKKLEADYTFNYGIRIAGNDIQFVKGYSSYRYMSFPVDKGLDIELNLGSEIKDPKAKLFKIAKPEELLNAFVYPTESPWNYEPKGTQEFYSGSGMTQIQEFGNLGQNNFIRHKVDAGLYYVAAFDGDKFIRGTWVSVTDLGVLLRQDDQNMYITAQKFSDQSQVNGADLNVYSLGGKPEALITGKLSGIWITKFEHPKRADIIMVRSGNDVAFLPLRLPSAEAEIGVYEN